MTEADHSAAEALAHAFLDKTGTSILNGDFQTYASCFHLPQRVETFDGLKLLETENDLKSVYESVHNWLLKMGATDFSRHILAAEFRGEDVLGVAYETRIMRDTELLADPYPNYGRIARIDGTWKIVDGMYATNIADLLDTLKTRLHVSNT